MSMNNFPGRLEAVVILREGVVKFLKGAELNDGLDTFAKQLNPDNTRYKVKRREVRDRISHNIVDENPDAFTHEMDTHTLARAAKRGL